MELFVYFQLQRDFTSPLFSLLCISTLSGLLFSIVTFWLRYEMTTVNVTVCLRLLIITNKKLAYYTRRKLCNWTVTNSNAIQSYGPIFWTIWPTL